MISKGESALDDQAFFQKLTQIALDSHVDIQALSTGYTTGMTMGSPNISVLEKPEIALLVDGGVDSYEAGEIWHLLDQRFEMPLTLLPVGSVNGSTLDRYTVLLMPDGNYTSLGTSGAAAIKSWVSGGGTIVAKGGAIQIFDQK